MQVEGGEVTLSGTVESRWAKRHAEDIIENISGVKHVQNNLRARDREQPRAGERPAAANEPTPRGRSSAA